MKQESYKFEKLKRQIRDNSKFFFSPSVQQHVGVRIKTHEILVGNKLSYAQVGLKRNQKEKLPPSFGPLP